MKGIVENVNLKTIGAKQWYKAGLQGYSCAISHLVGAQNKEEEEIPKEIQKLLELYAQIFQESKGLPPKRGHDHKIPLQTGSNLVNIRPYRHNHKQKGEVEKQVAEKLQNSVIQNCISPFASPVILVKKKITLRDCD